MTACPTLCQWARMWRRGLLSQHSVRPQTRHWRRWTHLVPSMMQSSQTYLCSPTGCMVAACSQTWRIAFLRLPARLRRRIGCASHTTAARLVQPDVRTRRCGSVAKWPFVLRMLRAAATTDSALD